MNKFEHNAYLSFTDQDRNWGIVCTTVGRQRAVPQGKYPVDSHPTGYQFRTSSGRTLHEYQLVYISEGSGWFKSAHCKRTHVSAGTVMILFPGEEHAYAPNRTTGWREHWVGFLGAFIDARVKAGFFSPEHPLVRVGNNPHLETLYEEIIRIVEAESIGCQLLASSIVLQILSRVIFCQQYGETQDTRKHIQIEQAQTIMRNHLSDDFSPEQVAREIGVSYSYLRRIFSQICGIAPYQYMIQLKHRRAKELLVTTTDSISDIAYDLNFNSPQQFSQLFHRMEGITPREYRQRYIK